MITKQEIYSKLAQIVNTSDNHIQIKASKNLASKLMIGNINLSDANLELAKIVNLQRSPMLDSIQGKRVYKNLVRYHNGILSDRNEILKLISSVITHGVIESQSNPKMDLESLVSLSTYLSNSLSSITYFDKEELDNALDKAGIGKEVILIEQ